jgi:uncharacterized membrane protein
LLRQWPSYLAFLMSFIYIGVMWINHHRMFTHIRRSDDVLLVLNLLLLLGVSVVPYPTAILAQYLGRADQRTAAVFYNATFFVIAIFFNILWRYAIARRLLDKSVNTAYAENISRQYAVGPIVYLICLGLAWVNVHASISLNAALAIFFALPASLVRRRQTRPDNPIT